MTKGKEVTTVFQANPLVEARRDFTLIESRLFYLGLKGVVPKLTNKDTTFQTDTEFPVTVIPANELISMFGNYKYYSTLRTICREFAKKTVEIKTAGEDDFKIYPVFAELSYQKGEGLRIEFNRKMKPWLLDLADKAFTRIPFEEIWQLRSAYSVRMLELCLQYQNTPKHERVLTIEEIRQYLCVPDNAYRDRLNNFKRYILDNTIQDINEKTSFKIEYENIKDGRRIVAFKFTLHLPAEVKKQKAKAQIKDIQSLVQSTADNSAMSGQKPATTPDEKRAIGKQYASAFIESLKNSK